MPTTEGDSNGPNPPAKPDREPELAHAAPGGRRRSGYLYGALGLAAAALMVVIISVATNKGTIDIEQEAAKFQGTWVLIRTHRDGKLKPASDNPALLTFSGTHYIIGFREIKDSLRVQKSGTWKLNPSKRPKEIDRVGVNAKKEPVTLIGIYEWTGDGKLRLCSSRKERPNEFSAPPGSEHFVQIWAHTER